MDTLLNKSADSKLFLLQNTKSKEWSNDYGRKIIFMRHPDWKS